MGSINDIASGNFGSAIGKQIDAKDFERQDGGLGPFLLHILLDKQLEQTCWEEQV